VTTVFADWCLLSLSGEKENFMVNILIAILLAVPTTAVEPVPDPMFSETAAFPPIPPPIPGLTCAVLLAQETSLLLEISDKRIELDNEIALMNGADRAYEDAVRDHGENSPEAIYWAGVFQIRSQNVLQLSNELTDLENDLAQVRNMINQLGC
jgi:hypothetical protein